MKQFFTFRKPKGGRKDVRWGSLVFEESELQGEVVCPK